MKTDVQEFIESWDKFCADPKNKTTFDVTTLKPVPEHNVYLENRLHAAFRKGFSDGYTAALHAAVDRLTKVIFTS